MNIALIGMMGSGKTTIGKHLCDSLRGFSFYDTDEEIVKLENRSINEIFECEGEEYFRKIESEVLKKILNSDNNIISTGGGIIKNTDNSDVLLRKSVTIYLYARAEVLYNRIKNNKERPLLNNVDMEKKIFDLLKQREDKYKKAKYIIDTNNKTQEEIVKEITVKLGIHE